MADENDDYDLIRLDRSRHFAVVAPPENGAHFHQDDLYFDHSGRIATEWLSEKDKERIRRKIARAKAEQAADRARRDALKKAGLDPDQADEDALKGKATGSKAAPAVEPEKGDGSTVDLKAWARGELKVSWFKVRQAFVAQHSKEVENKEDALIFLADQGLIGADEVGV